MLKVVDGAITSSEHEGLYIENMAMVVDKSCGTVLKFGDINHSNIKGWFDDIIAKYHKSGLSSMADDLMLVEFDKYLMGITQEEICTVVNYGMNCHSPKFASLFSLPATKLREEIARLHALGF